MARSSARLAKLESAAGHTDLTRLSDAELEARIAAAWAELELALAGLSAERAEAIRAAVIANNVRSLPSEDLAVLAGLKS